MAKFAAVFLALLALQGAFAGIYRRPFLTDSWDEGAEGTRLATLLNELQSACSDLRGLLNRDLPQTKQAVDVLLMQSSELADGIQMVIQRLQGSVGTSSEILGKLNLVKDLLRQVGDYSEMANTGVLQQELSSHLQSAVEQLEILVRWAQTEGGLRELLQDVLLDFVQVIQRIKTQIRSISLKGLGAFGTKRWFSGNEGILGVQIRSVTEDLVQILDDVQIRDVLGKKTMIELIARYMQELQDIVGQIKTGKGVLMENVGKGVWSLDANREVPVEKIKIQLGLCVRNIAQELQALDNDNLISKDIIVRFLTITRDLQNQLLGISSRSSGIDVQIQVLTNGLIASLESLSADDIQARRILESQIQDLAIQIESIIERLIKVNDIRTRKIVPDLQQTMAALRQGGLTGENLKIKLIGAVQDISVAILNVLSFGDEPIRQRGIGLPIEDVVGTEIAKDLVVTLQKLQMEVQTVFLGGNEQSVQRIALQIQAATNNLVVLLENVQGKQNVQIQVRELAHQILSIVWRLEKELGSEDLRQVAMKLQDAVALQEDTNSLIGKNEIATILQRISIVLRRLPWGTLDEEGGIRSILIQYLIALQQAQIEVQIDNKNNQLGQSPEELALQIQLTAQRLGSMLRIVPIKQQISLTWQVRRLSQILDSAVDRLRLIVPDALIVNLRQIQEDIAQISTETVLAKNQLAEVISDVAVEIQKLIWLTRSDEKASDAIKGILMEILCVMQNLQWRIQTNLQIVAGEEPRALAIRIRSVLSRILSVLEWMPVQTNSQGLRQILVIQIGELTQAIENIIQMLHSQKLRLPLGRIVDRLEKIEFLLQETNAEEARLAVVDLRAQLLVGFQDTLVQIEKLCAIAETEIEGSSGSIHGILNNFLSNIRSMLIQVENVQQRGWYDQGVEQLADQIQTINTKLLTSIQTVIVGDKLGRQALAIESLVFARRLQKILERLELVLGIPQVNLRQVVIALQQVGTALNVESSVQLKTLLNNQIQTANAEIQKLLTRRSSLSPGIRSVLIEYLATLQNLQVRMETISLINLNGFALPQMIFTCDVLIDDTALVLQRAGGIQPAIALQARQMVQVLDGFITKLQMKTVGIAGDVGLLQRVVDQLRDVQMVLRGAQIPRNVLVISLHRATGALEQLTWSFDPRDTTGMATLVREILNDFIIAVQNINLQLQIVWQNRNLNGLERINIRGWGMESQAPTLLTKMKTLINELMIVLQTTESRNIQGLITSTRQLSQVVDAIIDRLPVGTEQIRLRGIQKTLQALAATGVFGSVQDLKTELQTAIQAIGSQVERLVLGEQGDIIIVDQLVTVLQNILGQIQGETGIIQRISSFDGSGSDGVFGWKTTTMEQARTLELLRNIQVLTDEVTSKLQSTPIAQEGLVASRCRQLIQIIEDVDAETPLGNWRSILLQLQQIAGRTAVGSQIRGQLVTVIRDITDELRKMSWGIQTNDQIVGVMEQYLAFLDDLKNLIVSLEGATGTWGAQRVLGLWGTNADRSLNTIRIY